MGWDWMEMIGMEMEMGFDIDMLNGFSPSEKVGLKYADGPTFLILSGDINTYLKVGQRHQALSLAHP